MKIMTPQQIEEESLRIIDQEAGQHDRFTAEQWQVVRRMIHATADFDFMRSVRFHPMAIAAAENALRRGSALYADTEMLRSGAGRAAREAWGCELITHVSDDDVIRESRATGRTRSTIALRKAAPRLNGALIAIGNAPTALHEAVSLCESGVLQPALVIGFPVGFVEAKESKERLWGSGVVCITNLDRKGGTPAAAAAINALVKLAQEA